MREQRRPLHLGSGTFLYESQAKNSSMHSKISSSGRNSYPCSICSRRLTSPYKLREHLMIHTGEKPHACSDCKQAFRTKPDLARHRRIHTGEKPYSCPLCGQSFHRSDNLRGHMKVHSKEALRCPTCGDFFVDLNELQRHMKKHGESKAQHDKASSDKSEIIQDVDAREKIRSKDHQHSCVDCGSTFFQKGALAMHMKLVHPESPAPASPKLDSAPSQPAPETAYVCLNCGQSFEDLNGLQKHMDICGCVRIPSEESPENLSLLDNPENHSGLDENMNSEDALTLVIDTDSDDSESMDRNRSEDSVDCSSPDQNGSKEGDYKKPEKPHVCEDCGEKFAWKQDLNRHTIMAHTGHVPYRCTACGKGFIRQDRLVAHIRVHTGKSPHTCDHCQKTFTASSSLKEHLKIHTGEKPHHCQVCGKYFRQKCVLTRHMRNVHKDYQPTEQMDTSNQDSMVSSPHIVELSDKCGLQPLDFSVTRQNGVGAQSQNHFDQVPRAPNHSVSTPPKQPPSLPATPTLLKQLQSEQSSSRQDVVNGSLYSCAACAMPFSNESDLSTHLLTRHVGKPESSKMAPRNGIPNGIGTILQSASIKIEPACAKIKEEFLQLQDNCSPPKRLKLQEGSEFTADDTKREYKEAYVNGISPTSLTQGIQLTPLSLQEQNQAPVFFHMPRNILKCALCGLTCSSQEQLHEHTDSHLRADPFFCSLCSETFRNTTDLEEHTKTHSELIENIENLKDPELCDSAGEGSVMCGVCREHVEEEGELSEHMRMHCPGRDGVGFTCMLCDLSFDTPVQVNDHLNNIHCSSPGSEYQLRLYGCNFCSKPFKKIRTLVLHLKTHLLEKPFQCDFCGKGFTQKMYLKQHLRTHTGERPYRCSWCDRGFIQKTQLTLHERQHRGETPFKCSHCDKAFTNKSVLKLHLTTHLPLPPHQCTTCGRRFTQAGNLRRHISMVHREEASSLSPVKMESGGLEDLQPLNLSTVLVDHDSKDDGDDLVVMGAYYQQKATLTPPRSDPLTPAQPQSDLLTPAQSQSDLLTPSQSQSDPLTPAQSQSDLLTPSQPQSDLLNLTQSKSDLLTPAQPQPKILNLTQSKDKRLITGHSLDDNSTPIQPLRDRQFPACSQPDPQCLPIDCTDCVRGFSDPQDVWSHVITHHTGMSLLQ